MSIQHYFKCFLIVLMLSGGSLPLYAQNDSINRIDEQEWKQGRWVTFATADNPGCKEGQRIEEGTYKDNRKINTWKKYWCNGKLKSIMEYREDRTIYSKSYNENGNLSEEGTWNSQGWIGPYKYYHENGQLYYEWIYDQGGKRTGQQKYYYPNGNIMYEGDWNEGKESGLFKEYYEDGSLKAEKNFSDGKLDTNSVKSYPQKTKILPKEKIQEDTPKKENPAPPENIGLIPDGFQRIKNREGKITMEGEFKTGKMINGKEYFYKEGVLEKTAIIREGKVERFEYEKDKIKNK